MIIKVGQTKNLDVSCFFESNPNKEEKIPSNFSTMWLSERTDVLLLEFKNGGVQAKGLKAGTSVVSVKTYKKSVSSTEVFVSSIAIKVEDDSKPPIQKAGIVKLMIKEK